jgi:parvulin-like peptidyl-prolyl isomerase
VISPRDGAQEDTVSEECQMEAEFDSADNVKDRTKWWWLGVGLVLCLMVLAMWQWSHLDPRQSVVQARHILIAFDARDPAAQDRALKLARDIRQRVLDGESFSKLAETYSNDPGSAQKGGYLGTLKKGDLVGEIEKFVWNAPIDQLSDVIKTRYGFHLVIVNYRKVSKAEQAVEAERVRLEQELERRKQEGQQQQ